MSKRIGSHTFFWVLSAVFLTIFIGSKSDNIWFTVLFVGILLPVAIATSYTFIYFLFPRYLFPGVYFRFFLYAFFFITLSIYLQMMIVVSAFIFIANYNYENMIPGTTNIINLGVGMYFIVFLSALIHLVRRWTRPETTSEPEQENYILVRENREMIRIETRDILYIESLDNYVKIHTSDKVVITKERISKLAKDLPEPFIRIHRSYVVNRDKIDSFSKETINLSSQKLPISRTYKARVMEHLGST